LNIVPVARNPRVLALVAATLVALAAAVALLLTQSAPAPADANLSNLFCRGHIGNNTPLTDEVGDTNVKYVFACSGPFTGFQLLSSNEVQGFDTEVFGSDAKTGDVVSGDQFSCTGALPGYGVNCGGFANFLDNKTQEYDSSKRSFDKISGTFTIDGDICAEPRTDVVLFVSTATKKGGAANGEIVQALSGPFELGRPSKSGCKPTALSGKTRVPLPELDSKADDSDIG